MFELSPTLPAAPRGLSRRLSFAALAEWFWSATPPDGSACRVLAVDGMSGSGKSTFAALAGAAIGAPVFHIDDIIPGWSAVAESIPLTRELVLAPLCDGRPARWRRYDWDALSHQEEQRLDPGAALVLDGCGSGARLLAPYLTLIAWVDATPAQCERRVRARPNWYQYADYRESWIRQEQALQAAELTTARADLVVDSQSSRLATAGQRHFVAQLPASAEPTHQSETE